MYLCFAVLDSSLKKMNKDEWFQRQRKELLTGGFRDPMPPVPKPEEYQPSRLGMSNFVNTV